MDTPLYGGVLMSIGYLAIFLKNFFVVTVGGKLSVEDLTDTNTKRGGTMPHTPDIPNNCKERLGYLAKKSGQCPLLILCAALSQRGYSILPMLKLAIIQSRPNTWDANSIFGQQCHAARFALDCL